MCLLRVDSLVFSPLETLESVLGRHGGEQAWLPGMTCLISLMCILVEAWGRGGERWGGQTSPMVAF